VYTVKLRAIAHKDLRRLPPEVHARVLDQLISLQEEPRPRGVEKLSGRKGWRVRVGDYRIVYEIDDQSQEVIIYRIRHRKEVYRVL
jgi:mRNA interferase RelE/StbE